MSVLFFFLLVFLSIWLCSLSKRIKELETAFASFSLSRKENAPRKDFRTERSQIHTERKDFTESVPSRKELKQPPAPVFANPQTASGEGNETSAPEKEKAPFDFKQTAVFNFLGRNLNVWLAAGAGLLGVFFFIKYSVDNGLLSPAVRLILAAVAGAAAIIGGEILFKREKVANNERIAQVLTGIGLSALYFTSYALSRVYDFTSAFVSFALMCVVSVLSVFLCFRHCKTPLAENGVDTFSDFPA